MDTGGTHCCRECNVLIDPGAVGAENTPPNVENGQPVQQTETSAVRKKNNKVVVAKPVDPGLRRRSASPVIVEEGGSPRDAAPEIELSSDDAFWSIASSTFSDSFEREVRPKNADLTEPGKFSQHIATSIRLDEILSGGSQIDHPLCTECTDTLIDTVDERLKEAESLRADHETCYARLIERDAEEEESIEELQAELAQIEADEEQLMERYKALEIERSAVFHQRDLMFKERERLEKGEEEDSMECLLLQREWFAASEELISLRNQYEYAKERLRVLNDTDVFEQRFRIECNGTIGKINGFRLGKLRSDPVKWTEINLAWGEATFMLDMLMRLFKCKPKDCTLMPFGDKSHIIKPLKNEGELKKLPLYIDARTSSESRFEYDIGLVTFLNIMEQLERELAARYGNFAFIHPMSKGTIVDNQAERTYSIRLQMNDGEGWTNALKCMLVNLRQLLALYKVEM